MTMFEDAAIIGLGLIGGSLARDLSARGVRVRAYDIDERHLQEAVQSGCVHESMDRSLAGVRESDLIVVAVPVDSATEVLQQIAPHAARAKLITDVGSTKTRIVERAAELGLASRFVGSHPMAGDHRSGWRASRLGLVDGARVYLCPPADAPRCIVDLAAEWWSWLGARPIVMSAELHDRKLAWTSHLPHMVSTALALALANANVERGDLGPGGRDMTRLAGSSADVWTAIARDNAAAIDTALVSAEREIAALRAALNGSNAEDLRERFAAARAWFDA
jgi:prephenate dehydrogenase